MRSTSWLEWSWKTSGGIGQMNRRSGVISLRTAIYTIRLWERDASHYLGSLRRFLWISRSLSPFWDVNICIINSKQLIAFLLQRDQWVVGPSMSSTNCGFKVCTRLVRLLYGIFFVSLDPEWRVGAPISKYPGPRIHNDADQSSWNEGKITRLDLFPIIINACQLAKKIQGLIFTRAPIYHQKKSQWVAHG